MDIQGGALDNSSNTAVTLGNSSVTVDGNFSFLGSSTTNDSLTLAGTVLLTGNRTATVNAGTLSVGVISDTPSGGSSQHYSLTKSGTGNLVLTGSATYTGDTYINGGVLDITGYNQALNSTPTIHFANGGQLSLRGHSNATALAGSVILDIPTGQSGTIYCSDSPGVDPAGFTSGQGTLTLSTAANKTVSLSNGGISGSDGGGWNQFTGTLLLRNTGTTGTTFRTTWNSSTVPTMNPLLALDIGPYCTFASRSTSVTTDLGSLSGGDSTSYITTTSSNNNTYVIGSLNTNTVYSGLITSTVMITKVGTGTLTLAGNNTYCYTSTAAANYNSTTISAGTLQIGNGGTSGTLGANNTVTVSGTTYYLGSVLNNASLVFNRSNSLSVPNPISGTGSITVNGGTIYLDSTSVANSVNVSAGAVLGGRGVITQPVTVSVGGGIEDGENTLGGKLSVGSLSFLGTGLINYTQPTGTNPLTVSGGVTTNGANTVTLNIAGTALNNGTYDLIKYGTSITNFGDFTLGITPPNGARVKTYSLVNNSSNKEVDLSVVGVDNNTTWTGAAAGATWDNTVRLPGTTDWKFTATGAATDFYTGDNVTFSDTGVKTVTIAATVMPASVTFTNSTGNDYTFTGSYGIANGATLLKASGAGRVTLGTNNSYTGATTIDAGTISIASDGVNPGDSAPLGVIPAVAAANNVILNGGALNASATFTLNANRGVALGPAFTGTGVGAIDVDASQTLTVAGVIANNGDPIGGYGTGSLNKTGAGTLILNVANTYSGTTTISGGTLSLANLNALQNTTLNYNNQGGTLNFGSLSNSTVQTIGGSGNTTTTAVALGGLSGARPGPHLHRHRNLGRIGGQ